MIIRARISHERISAGALAAELPTRDDGALVLFEGVVRAERDAAGRELVALDYTAYESMAQAEFQRICEDAARQCEISSLGAVHRLGRLSIGEASIAIVVASPHRAAAFDVCRAVIEQTKIDLPVFKREIWADGAAGWVNSI